jgi:hypothetical protein
LPSSQNEVINNEDDDLYSEDLAIDEDPHDETYSPDILELLLLFKTLINQRNDEKYHPSSWAQTLRMISPV